MNRCFLISWTIFWIFGFIRLSAQVPSNATASSFNKPVAWPANSYVNVYIDVSTIPYQGSLYNMISARVEDTSGVYGNGVTYSTPTPISGCSDVNLCPLAAGTNQLFTAGSLTGNEAALNDEYFNASGPDSGSIQNEISSHITIDPNQLYTTSGSYSEQYASRVISHELEHDYGVGDAPDADPSQTIMSYQASPDDPGIIEPSDYDFDLGANYSGGGGGGNPYHSPCSIDDPCDSGPDTN